MNYTHLTLSERSKIENYLELGYSIRAIAKRIHRLTRVQLSANV
ncbi:MAG: helix-turn-helix domain-containing protein [Solibacillus sp.]